jgi:hypothetical protein
MKIITRAKWISDIAESGFGLKSVKWGVGEITESSLELESVKVCCGEREGSYRKRLWAEIGKTSWWELPKVALGRNR